MCLRGGGLPGAGTYVTPSLTQAGCVITTSGLFSFLFSGGSLKIVSEIFVLFLRGVQLVLKFSVSHTKFHAKESQDFHVGAVW